MNLTLPELSLVIMIGASGSGKSMLARRLFKPTEILSSDTCRGWISDDENDQAASNDAFDVLHYLLRKRLSRGRDRKSHSRCPREPLPCSSRVREYCLHQPPGGEWAGGG